MDRPPAARSRNGRPLVLLLYSSLTLLALLIAWFSIHHPKNQAFQEGTFLPLARCLEILGSDTIRVDYLQEEQVLRICGIDSPSARPDRLDPARNPEREENIARQILQGWIYRKQLKLTFPGADSETVVRDEEGRLLAYAELYGVDIGGKMIQEGQVLAAEIDHPRREDYLHRQQEAEASGQGLYRGAGSRR